MKILNLKDFWIKRMFTGIITEIGQIVHLSPQSNGYSIGIKSLNTYKILNTGDSIAVNGICLTANNILEPNFYADISLETFNKTIMRFAKIGDWVNLETPCRPDSFLSGHIVSGHIDTTATVMKVMDMNRFKVINFLLDSKNDSSMIIEKGSICINGISLTLYDIKENLFSVSIIPETVQRTNLKYLIPRSRVNIEFDIIGKYIIKWLNTYNLRSSNDDKIKNLLNKSGFI